MQVFPKVRHPMEATEKHGVYIIYKSNDVLHVGRTLRGKRGLNQRLRDHLNNSSSFAVHYLDRNGSVLRKKGYFFKCLEISDARERALLEAYAIGNLCPEHIGLGE